MDTHVEDKIAEFSGWHLALVGRATDDPWPVGTLRLRLVRQE